MERTVAEDRGRCGGQKAGWKKMNVQVSEDSDIESRQGVKKTNFRQFSGLSGLGHNAGRFYRTKRLQNDAW